MINYILDSIKMNKTKDEITNGLVNTAIEKGSQDNVTVIIVDLREFYQQWQESIFLRDYDSSD